MIGFVICFSILGTLALFGPLMLILDFINWMSNRKKRKEFPASTCVECGRTWPSGTVQRCTGELTQFGGWCSHRVPSAVARFIKDGKK